jgi:hypothetical protein
MGVSGIEFVAIEDNTPGFGFAQENVQEFWNCPAALASNVNNGSP